MKKPKSVLQKISVVIGYLCFLLAVLCAIALYFKRQELGMQDTVTVSFLAATFFFALIGFVFTIIGKADLPDFKIEK